MISFSDNERRADYQELRSSSSGPWRDPECSSSAPRQRASENLEKVKNPRRIYSRKVCGLLATSNLSKEFLNGELRIAREKLGLLSIIYADLFLSSYFPTIHVSSTYEGRLAITKKKKKNNRQNIRSLCFRGTTFPFWGTQFRLENRRCDGTNGRAWLDVA